MNIRDRVKALRRVRAADLRPNPLNWRLHPKPQQEALRGILAEIGFVDALVARELPDGALELIDGHLRAETAAEALVPVLVVDLNDAEARKVLATFDPLACLAETDEQRLAALLEGVQTANQALSTLLEDLAREAGQQADCGQAQAPVIPERWDLLVQCQTEERQTALLGELSERGFSCRALIS
jgi:hypothetical protein